jgi:hypothetical protein
MFVISVWLRCLLGVLNEVKEPVNSFVLYLRAQIFWWNVFNDLYESGCVVAFFYVNAELLACNLNIICIQRYFSFIDRRWF